MFAAPEPGSPKFQLQPVTVPGVTVDASVKQVGFPMHTGTELKLATGSGFTTTVVLFVSLHPELLVTINETVYVPADP